jgi:dCMP deaminase
MLNIKSEIREVSGKNYIFIQESAKKPYAGTEEKMERRDKVNYYLDLAETVSKRSTCLRKHYGAVIVNNDEVISTGYVGAPRGRKNCTDLGECIRNKLNIPRGERYELCRSVHAEANAIISASRDKMLGSSLYLVGVDAEHGNYIENSSCCSMCKRMVINAGIEKVYIRDTKDLYRIIEVTEWINHDESLEGTFGY